MAEPGPSRWPEAALGFSICAALASWNPLAAPLGVVLGIASAFLGWRLARKAVARRRLALWASAVGLAAALAGTVVLLLSAGALSIDLPGQPVVEIRSAAEAKRVLDEAAARTRASRERAAAELEKLAGPRERDGGPRVPPDGGRPKPRPGE